MAAQAAMLSLFFLSVLLSATNARSTATIETGGLAVLLWEDQGTVRALNVSVPTGGTWSKANNFSFVPERSPSTGCHSLGDLTLRIRSSDSEPWAYRTSASGTSAEAITSSDPSILAAHNITTSLSASVQDGEPPFPLTVLRTYESSPNGGVIIRFNITNSADHEVKIGGLGLPMPAAGMEHGIEQSVWNDPHIGQDHGWVEWSRVVIDERTMLGVPAVIGEGFEAWRPIMENTCGNDVWELNTHSAAWAAEWASNQQWPYLYMTASLNSTGMWPNPKSPWPAWHGHDTVPITDFAGMAQPWNPPSERTLQPREEMTVAIQLVLAQAGPRTRDAALQKAGKATFHAIPGYVLSKEMKTASLIVELPEGVKLLGVNSSDMAVMTVSLENDVDLSSTRRISVRAEAAGRARVEIALDDGSIAVAHYAVVPSDSLAEQVARVGSHWANDAWLPRDFKDPFGRSASVMPWDRENREHVLDDSRAYDVGLSDDAGGGNPLGFAIKVAHAPISEEVQRVDDYIQWTLYGVKPDTAQPPLKSLQLRPEDGGDTDGIRMTMYYYDNAAHPSANWSGHFSYDYKEQSKCGHAGIEGGPNWCMDEGNANATYRAFNYPHHCASYYAMYRVARYHSNLRTRMPWQWYLWRAANTTIKFGAPSVGVMDGTLFREVLRSVDEEASEDATTWGAVAMDIRANMLRRAMDFASKEYPYGSEFAFDTTGQEEVVIWLMYFANTTNRWNDAAKRTVDHVLSYMRSSPTWAYHGGTRSWGDLGNNGKWMPSFGTAAGFVTRGNMHYRSGLNSIPLLEWYRSNPDDFSLLEIGLGAQTGQMMNIDDHGAPSMMMHMLPHILDFDPHSGDYGLGFFGHTIEAGSYYVSHDQYGDLCFLCDISKANDGALTYTPLDSYKQRTFIEPVGLYVQADAGTFASISFDLSSKRLTLTFSQPTNATFSTRRLRLDKQGTTRPGSNFRVVSPNKNTLVRGAYEFAASESVAVVEWD